MITNGLYVYESEALDGGDGGYRGVVVLRDGRWKGELTQQEQTPAPYSFPTARRIVNAGFTGTYTDKVAEFEATAHVGKRSLRYHANIQLLIPV